MCVCAGGEGNFNNTKCHAAIVKHPQTGELVHTLAYSVNATAVEDGGHTGRALFVAVPSVPNSLTSENLIDTSDFPTFVDDQVEAVKPKSRGDFPTAFTAFSDDFEGDVQVVTCGEFTVVIATNARDLPRALSLVPAEKRPELSDEYCQTMQQWYGNAGWAFVLACFDSTLRQDKPSTFFLWYKSQYSDQLFVPGLDEHTGRALPKPGEPVKLDHILTFSAPGMVAGVEVTYTAAKKVRACGFIPEQVRGFGAMHATAANGDFMLGVDQLLQAEPLQVRRVLPPGFTPPNGYQETVLKDGYYE